MPSLFASAGAAPRAELASGSAVLATARQLGSALGVAIFVAVLGAHPATGLAGFDRAWAVVLITAAMTAFAGLALGRRLIGIPEASAKTETAGNVSQARLHRQRTATSAARRPPLHWIPARLRPDHLPGHRPPPAARGKTVVLRDGSAILIRQIHRADAPLLADGFTRLSAQSRQMRFLTAKKELSPAELRYFTDLDHHDHEALGALDHAGGRGVGIARYVRDAHDPHTAEIAVTIVDDWQGRGLGTELLAQLSDRARQEGIRYFIALVSAGNSAIDPHAAERERRACPPRPRHPGIQDCGGARRRAQPRPACSVLAMTRPVAHQADSARIHRHHHVTETRQTQSRSADRSTGPITPILARDERPRGRPGCRTYRRHCAPSRGSGLIT